GSAQVLPSVAGVPSDGGGRPCHGVRLVCGISYPRRRLGVKILSRDSCGVRGRVAATGVCKEQGEQRVHPTRRGARKGRREGEGLRSLARTAQPGCTARAPCRKMCGVVRGRTREDVRPG